jgi:beta-mannosidase
MAKLARSTLAVPIALEGWSFVSSRSSAETPEELANASSPWLPIDAPTTVAAALRSKGQWDFGCPRAFDSETWWYRCRLPAGPAEKDERWVLRIGGLATLADVFVDGQHVLRSENMFHEHRIDLTEALHRASTPSASGHELLFRFGPLAPALATRRPRPRWKTRLASHQQLRWIRTSLVGRMPGWSPPVPPIGPWRSVVLERCSRLMVERVDVHASIVERPRVGKVRVSLRGATLSNDLKVTSASLIVGEVRARLEVTREAAEIVLAGELSLPNPKLWWPHTHGAPDRYAARIEIAFEGRGTPDEIDLGSVAFRTLKLDTSDRGFAISVNDVPMFCRGAVWTTTDVATLVGTQESYDRVLGAVRDAGMNMLRLSGTMFYEDDAFYETCDALGILVWQDFAFANMDYPIDDDAFRASVTREATQLLDRLQNRPCLAVLCGGSEVEQQAAMFGAAREIWRGPLFDRVLPDACAAVCPDVPYWPNSPSGGALPFHVDEGVAHYYGVGAYLRPEDDARRAKVRFASECLAFANVPEDDLFPLFLGEGEAPFVHAKWKERTSKDHGSGWDFEDVRDHYVGRLFKIDPARVRYENMERYLEISRVASGEMMARVFAEWRRRDASCRGGLVWFLQDLWPGAGWGVLDSRGLPKSPWWYLRRALAPRALSITDEGVNGLHLHVVNDRSDDIRGVLSFALYRDGEVRTAHGSTEVVVPARSAIEVAADALLGTFADTAVAYRFGPPGHDVAVASIVDAEGATIVEATHLVDFAAPPPCTGIEATLVREGDALVVKVRSKRFAHAVAIHVSSHVAEDNYFDIPPGGTRTIALRSTGAPSKRAPSGTLTALNLRHPVSLFLDGGTT